MQPDHVVINELEIITEGFLRKVLYIVSNDCILFEQPGINLTCRFFLLSQSWTRLELVKFSAVSTGRFFWPKVGSFSSFLRYKTGTAKTKIYLKVFIGKAFALE